MPQEIFEKVTSDDGTIEYVPVSIDKLEIPDDVVRTTKAYKDVLDESVSRRQKVKTLSEQLAQATKVEDEKPPEPQPNEPLQFKSRQELLDFVTSEISNRDTEASKQRRAKEEQIDTVINKHKLDTDIKPFLMKLSVEEADEYAQYVGRQKLQFDSTQGNSGEQRQFSVEGLVEKVAAKLNLTQEK